jgi:hypothetical protein
MISAHCDISEFIDGIDDSNLDTILQQAIEEIE